MQGVAGQLLGCVRQRLGAQDQDQEVKDTALLCAGACVAALGDLDAGTTSALVQVHPLAWTVHPPVLISVKSGSVSAEQELLHRGVPFA